MTLRPRALIMLLYLWCGLAMAQETSDPFATDKLLPLKPEMRQGGAVIPQGGALVNPCAALSLDHPLNLLELVNIVLCNNPKTHEVWANTQGQAAQLGLNKAAYLPTVSLNAADSRTKSGNSPSADQRSVGVTLSYLLYDFGTRAAGLENARQLLAAAIATQDNTVQAVFLAAVQAYYQAQATYAALDAALESERAAKESFAAAEARYNAGSGTPADKLQAQTAYSQATLNRITIEGNHKNAQGALANMLGLDANRHVALVPANTTAMPNDFEGDVNTLIEAARQSRPDLQAAAAQVKAAQSSADIARATGRPSISLNASANRINSGGITSNNSLVGINLNVPIFSGFATTYRVRAAEAQADVKSSQLEQLRLQVALDVWIAYQNLTTATQSLRTTADLLNSAEQSAHVVLGRYKAGVGNIVDVLNAQSALASARQQRIQSTFNWNISRATLAQAMGNLDARLLQTLSGADEQSGENSSLKKQP